MRAIVLLVAAAFLPVGGALARAKPYDDREMPGKVVATARGLLGLVPGAYEVAERSAEFRGGKLRAKITELNVHVSTMRSALRRRGDPAELYDLRRRMLSITGKLIAEVEAFGRNAASFASVKRQIAAHMKKKPEC